MLIDYYISLNKTMSSVWGKIAPFSMKILFLLFVNSFLLFHETVCLISHKFTVVSSDKFRVVPLSWFLLSNLLIYIIIHKFELIVDVDHRQEF